LVKKLILLILVVPTLWASQFDTALVSLLGKSDYQRNRGMIKLLFKDRSKFIKDNHLDFVKITKTLEKNHLLDTKLKKISNIKISFATKQKNSLLFIKIVKEVLSTAGYTNAMTSKAIRDNSGFLWQITLKSKNMIDPSLIARAFEKREATITKIKKISKEQYRYDIDITEAKINALKLETNQETKLTKPLHPYWIDIRAANIVRISSLVGNSWHPYIVFYDQDLNILDNYTKVRKSYNISLKIPKDARYLKISDLYTLQNIKRGLKITLLK